jgi:hypothetical protein
MEIKEADRKNTPNKSPSIHQEKISSLVAYYSCPSWHSRSDVHRRKKGKSAKNSYCSICSPHHPFSFNGLISGEINNDMQDEDSNHDSRETRLHEPRSLHNSRSHKSHSTSQSRA